MQKAFYPRKRRPELDAEARAGAELLLEEAGEVSIPGLSLDRIFVVDQRRGRAYYTRHCLTVPLWAYRAGIGYFLYYLAHELAHFFSPEAGHGPSFMIWFKKLCPPQYWHHELKYKPRNAKAAGIKRSLVL